MQQEACALRIKEALKQDSPARSLEMVKNLAFLLPLSGAKACDFRVDAGIIGF